MCHKLPYVVWRIREIQVSSNWFNNVIYCITCTYCNKLYIGERGRQLGDRFREHLRDVERNDKEAFNIWHSAGFLISRQFWKLSSKSTLLIPIVSTSTFHSTNLFLFSHHHTPTNSVAPLSAYKPTHNPQFLHSRWQGANAQNMSFFTLYSGSLHFLLSC